MRTSAPSALACIRLFLEPGTRIASPKVVKITCGLLGDGDAIVDPPHRQDADRAPRPVHQLDLFGQHTLDPIAKDRMGVAAADFHDVERLLVRDIHRSDQRLDFPHENASLGAVAKFVEIFHAAAPLVVADPRSSASRVCTRSQRM